MKLLLDTQIVIWSAMGDPRLPRAARTAIADPAATITYSVVTIWEVAIKAARGRPDFTHHPRAMREAARRAGWEEVPVLAEHAIEVAQLADIHGDPFDRLLVAQARVEGLVLLSADATLLRYGHPVRRA